MWAALPSALPWGRKTGRPIPLLGTPGQGWGDVPCSPTPWRCSPGQPTSPRRRFALLRIVNVEKRRDSARGSRFLLELELQERGGGRLRLSEYVFLRLPGARAGAADGESPEPPPAASARPDGRPELCRPLRLAWRQDVMVHFIVPGTGVVGGRGQVGPPRPQEASGENGS